MIAIIIDTSKWLQRVNWEESEYLPELTEQVYSYAPSRYEGGSLEECMEDYVDTCNEAYSEHYAKSFKVHQILVYHNESDNETPYLLTDMTPFEKYFKQIRCYSWGDPCSEDTSSINLTLEVK